MTKKSFHSIFLASAAVMAACIALFLGVLYDYFGGLQAQQLSQQLKLASAGVESLGMDYLLSIRDSDCRLTWVDPNGTVLYDSTTDASLMENHAQRQEIVQAIESGTGESARYSSTLTQQTRYYAQRLKDGTVLRISVTRMTLLALTLSMLQPICAILAVALVLSGILAGRLSRNIVKPLEAIDLEQPLEGDTYPELSPLLTRMEQQHRQIRHQQKALEERQREFQAVVENMAEGLVLLSPKGVILSINPAAAAFFGAAEDYAGKAFFTLERDYAIGNAIQTAEQSGQSELTVSRNGREYQLSVSRVSSQGKESGVVLLVFDVTERVFAERNRREFTANVSHELKTPLQSIMGRAELMENGLVKPEDMPVFLRQIREQSAQLVSLIDDIIRLSQLDEKAELPVEPVDVPALIRQEAENLSAASCAKDVAVQIDTEDLTVSAPRPLLHEIVYNLMDNAIKYNVTGGSVTVRSGLQEGRPFIQVQDTGIGIPPEHQSRVFERFYRVDKSHSRQIGGTGLGLSIVKHAVLDLGGEIRLESTPGAGTTITVTLRSGAMAS